jgi:hypothetical protein
MLRRPQFWTESPNDPANMHAQFSILVRKGASRIRTPLTLNEGVESGLE